MLDMPPRMGPFPNTSTPMPRFDFLATQRIAPPARALLLTTICIGYRLAVGMAAASVPVMPTNSSSAMLDLMLRARIRQPIEAATGYS